MHVSVHICTVFYHVYVHVCIGVYASVCLYVEAYISRPVIFLFVLNLIFIYLRQDLSPNLELSDLEALASKSPGILHLPASSFLLLRL